MICIGLIVTLLPYFCFFDTKERMFAQIPEFAPETPQLVPCLFCNIIVLYLYFKNEITLIPQKLLIN